jgi:mono/diheme cytochrome c family protein
MKNIIDRTQFIEILLGLAGTILIVVALGLYIRNEPSRIEAAQNEILASHLDEGMTLYAENCSVCHGLAGEGLGAIPSLNTDALRSMTANDLSRIIAEGRYNTAMPAWSEIDGGPLSEYQVSELAALILQGDWQTTRERVVDLGLAPLVPFKTEPDSNLLKAVASLPDGETLKTAITIYASECVACHGADGLGTAIAPALNDEAVRARATDEINRTITSGVAGTLMAGWNNVLTPEQISAMVTLIRRWDEIPTGTIPAPDEPVAVTAESLALGSSLYATNCTRCHGPEGQGTQRAPALNVQSFLTTTTDIAVQQIITLGVPGTSMPTWGDRMTESEIQAVTGFIRQWEPTAPEVAVAVRIGQGGPPWMSNSTSSSSLITPQLQSTPSGETAIPAQVTPAEVNQPGAEAGSGHGGPPWMQSQVESQPLSVWQKLDWRILGFITIGLIMSFLLILAGYSSLKKSSIKSENKPNPPPETNR